MRERPIATLIFGILNLGFALMKLASPLLAMVMANIKLPGNSPVAALKSDPAYVALTTFSTWTNVTLGAALLAFGIGLLLLKNWARIGSMVYAVIDIVLVPVVAIISWPITKRMMEQMPGHAPGVVAGFALIGIVVGVCFSLAYPVLLLIFMTRPNVINACQPEQAQVPTTPTVP